MSSAADGGHWPKASVSAAIFRGESVLIVKSRKPAHGGAWSLPGGHIEAGETAQAAVAREVMEETGVAIRLGALVDVVDVIRRGSGGELTAHYVLAVYAGSWASGEPVPGDDVVDARFVAMQVLPTVTLLPGNRDAIAKAWMLASKGYET
jgi:8-oxo-dGTP diphosphatase